MRIGLIGDLEGETDAAVGCLRVLGERGDVEVAYQLGDLRFGMGADPEGYLAAIDSACDAYGLTLVCVPGNHEHWARLDAMWADPRSRSDDGSLLPLALAEHVSMVPRGHRWELGGRTFLALGSAPSINRHLLTEGVDWWPSEALLDEHVDAAIAGGHAEVMLTHDSPGSPYCVPEVEGILRGNVRHNPMGWPAASLAYADEGMTRLTRAVVGVQPLLLAHGHFHVAGEDRVRLPGAPHDTTVWSLAARQDPDTVRVLDLDTLTDPVD
ncbi:metallophosphoesterase family protein [Nocardioides lijunqiniae]|uniref:metallophosphoesterase family protein n=1 Tax=Nocardioides lijunqiniae TaxID=2760832 RepID=UPI0018779D1E|nr:metallophosphoesterase family protein [Nocardioides lijunqiniae]